MLLFKGDNREWKGVEGGADEARLIGQPCFKCCIIEMIEIVEISNYKNNRDDWDNWDIKL